MIKTFLTVFKINAAMSCNRFLYWLKRIPLIGRLFDDGLYSDLGAKQTVLIVFSVLKALYAFVGKFLYLAVLSLFLYLPLEQDLLSSGWPLFLWLLVCCSFFIGTLLQPDTLQANPLKYTCIRQLKLDPRRYSLIAAAKRHIIMFVTFTPALIAAALVYGQSAWAGLLISAELAACRLLGEAIHLLLFQRIKKIICRSAGYIIAIVMLGLFGGFGVFLAEVWPPMDRFLLHPVTVLSIMVLGLLSLTVMIRYPSYSVLARELCKPENVDISLAKEKAKRNAFRDVQLKDTDLNAEDTGGKIARLHGYAYLNALFFQRHRRLLNKPVKIELFIVGILGIGGVVLALLFREEMAAVFTELLAQFLPLSVFIIYFAANTLGTRICKAMFYNCDISLLRYGWYRQRNVVLRNFAIRLGQVTALNLMVAGALCLVFIFVAVLSGANPPLNIFVPSLLCILCLSVMFSVHPLFMYYIFQPYTSSLDVKNPFFTIINMVVYFACYACLQIKQPPSGFALLVLSVTIVYSAVALVTVFFRAPKTFRIK